jgi:hypothetical protein
MEEAPVSPLEIQVVIIIFGAMLTAILAICGYVLITITKHGERLGIVETQVSPLWARVQSQISSDLHHPDKQYSEMDDLLEKLDRLEITLVERERLKVLLRERATDTRADEMERSSARMMITVMERVLIEAHEARTTGARADDEPHPHKG